MTDRIALVTDFGASGPYVGQMQLLLSALLPRISVIDLVSDLVPYRPDLAAYILPALGRDMPGRTLYLCVVDPGVGGDRGVIAVRADGSWYVGPDNGLLALVARRAEDVRVLRVSWRPEWLSHSFHGRDLFAPIAAMLCDGTVPASDEVDCSQMAGRDLPNELPRLVYADVYGNLMTGLRAASLKRDAVVHAGGRELAFARTFCEVPAGEAFWYENAFGLVELAVNQGRADVVLGLGPGDPVRISGGAS
jgi:S-adenosylmethionine hydrolase